MNSQFTYFLLVAEELNMSRAAERAHVSHQGISTTIKSLEREYGFPLFSRKPKLSLTPEGEILVRALRKIKQIEDNMLLELLENDNNRTGTLKLGIPISRYDILVPDIVPAFKKMYPNMDIEITGAYSLELERMTENNELDFFISTGMIHGQDLKTILLMVEDRMLLASGGLLNQHFPTLNETQMDEWKRGISLQIFSELPFVGYPEASRTGHVLRQYAEDHNFQFNNVFFSNHPNTYAPLCRSGLCASVVPNCFLPGIASMNRGQAPEKYVYAFPIKDLAHNKTISLGYHKDRYLSKCYRDFIALIESIFENYQNTFPPYL